MSSDFCILNDQGAYVRAVGLDVNVHHEIMTLAKKKGLKYLLRAHEYYADAEFSILELEFLIREVEILKSECVVNVEIAVILDKLFELFMFAIKENKCISVIAD